MELGRRRAVGAEQHPLIFALLVSFTTPSTSQGRRAEGWALSFPTNAPKTNRSFRAPSSRVGANTRTGSKDREDDQADRQRTRYITDRSYVQQYGQLSESQLQYEIRMAPVIHCLGSAAYAKQAAENRARIAELQRKEALQESIRQQILNRNKKSAA